MPFQILSRISDVRQEGPSAVITEVGGLRGRFYSSTTGRQTLINQLRGQAECNRNFDRSISSQANGATQSIYEKRNALCAEFNQIVSSNSGNYSRSEIILSVKGNEGRVYQCRVTQYSKETSSGCVTYYQYGGNNPFFVTKINEQNEANMSSFRQHTASQKKNIETDFSALNNKRNELSREYNRILANSSTLTPVLNLKFSVDNRSYECQVAQYAKQTPYGEVVYFHYAGQNAFLIQQVNSINEANLSRYSQSAKPKQRYRPLSDPPKPPKPEEIAPLRIERELEYDLSANRSN